MTRLTVPAIAVLLLASGCHEIVSPGPPPVPLLRPPLKPALIQTTLPVPVTYYKTSAAGSKVELVQHNYYPYKSWIVVVANGPSFQLTAYGTAKPFSGPVGPTGVGGGYNPCDLNSRVSFGMVFTGFGDCGHFPKPDTALATGQGFIHMGSFPLSYTTPDLNECPPRKTPEVCHVQELTELSYTVFPIPVTARPVTANHRGVPFDSVSWKTVIFKTGAIPDTILISGAKREMPITITSWLYTASDGTLDGAMCPGGYPKIWCSVDLHKSGRMVVKAFTGGWEQTSSVTVQCRVSPPDSVLNDSTGDYQVREEIVDMLRRSHADSSSEAGWNASNPVGWRHETSISVWKMPSGSYKAVPYDHPSNNACRAVLSSVGPPGATFVGWGHDHPTPPKEPLYCPGSKVWVNNVEVPAAAWPGDTTETGQPRPIRRKFADGPHNAGSMQDWKWVKVPDSPGKVHYLIGADGFVYRFAAWPGPPYPRLWTTYRAFGGTAAQSKCAWVKKLIA